MMKKYLFLAFVLFLTNCQTAMTQSDTSRIRHMVVFKLSHPKGSAAEQDFLTALNKLAVIPGVENFNCMKQISRKNKFDYVVSMEFASQQIYNQYNSHPDHVAFVQQRWLKEVEDFMEIDFKPVQ
jgi:hypothetical protein